MKKLASILMAIIVVAMSVISAAPVTAFANNQTAEAELFAASGVCGENLTWELSDDGTLTISGSGDMTDWYSSNDVVWGNYKNDIEKIVIENGVTSIGLTAFFACSNLSEISIPASVTKIGTPVFSGYNCLSKIDVAENNPNFTAVDGILFSKDKTELLRYPNAKQGSYYKVPEGVTTIAGHAFGYSSKLLTVDLPSTLSQLGDDAFTYSSALTDINVADGNSKYCSVGGVLFDSNKTVLLRCPEGKAQISSAIPQNVKRIESDAFRNCKALTSVTLPNNLEYIGNSAFNGCRNLKEVNIPYGITKISGTCFASCTSLKSIVIPDSVTSIDIWAFNGCSALESITIPASVTEINQAFLNCRNVTIYGYSGSYAQTYAAENSIPFVALGGGVTENIVASGECGGNLTWKLTNDGKLTICGTGSMTDWTGYSSVPWYSNRSSVKNVVIEAGVTHIGKNAFAQQYPALESAKLPEGLVSIGDKAFNGCEKLSAINIPDSVTSIGTNAFSACTSLSSVSLSRGITTIPRNIFHSCVSLKSIIVPEGVTTIESYAFNSCTALETVELPETLTSISNDAFASCRSLNEVTVGKNVTNIGFQAFYNCPNLTIYGYTDSAAETYACENSISFVALDADQSTARGTVSFANDAYLADGGELIVDIWADGRDTGDYLKQRFVVNDLSPIPFEFTFSGEETAVGIRVMITNLSNAETNLYTSSSSNLDFTLTENGLDPDAYPRENYIDINRLAETPIVMPTGKMIYGKIIADDYNSVTTELMTVLLDNYYWTRAVIDPETGKYFAIMPYNFGGGTFTPRIEKSSEGAVSNIIPGFYNYGDPESAFAQTVTIDPTVNYSGLDFHVKTGYALSGAVRVPEDAIFDNYDLYCYMEIDGERYYITGLMTYKSFGDGLREVPYMIAFSPEQAAALSDFVPTLYVDGGMKDDMLGDSSYCNVYLNKYMYSANSTVLDESKADTVKLSSDISGIDFNLQTGADIAITAKLPEEMQPNYIWVDFYVFDSEGKLIQQTEGRFSPDSDTLNTSIIIPKSYICEQIKLMYRLQLDYDQQNPLYLGKGYICPDGNIVGLRKHADAFTVSNNVNAEFTLALNSQVEIYETFRNSNGEYLESAHPYSSYSTYTSQYQYSGNDYVIGNKVTFSPLSQLYEYLSGASFTITDGFGNVTEYTPEQFNKQLSGEEILIPGSGFTIRFTTKSSWSDCYGYAVMLVENVIGERPNTTFSAQDTTTLEYISGASIKITKNDGSFERLIKTNAEGAADTALENGIYNVSVYKEGYRPRSFVIEKTEENCEFAVYINSNDILTVSTNVKEMTREEMRDAGIDFDAYKNKNVYECTAVIRFSPENEITLDYICTDSEIITGEPVRTENAVIYPVSKDIFLIIHSNVTWLKEMFDVELLVSNTSAVETVEDCVAQLNLPEGLSLAVMTEEAQDTTVSLGDIAPAGSGSHHWYVCGDAEGTYYINGTVRGTRAGGGINEQITIPFTTSEPITVLGGSAMHLLIESEKHAVVGEPYRVRFTLENVSDKTLYDLALNILGGKFYEQYSVEDLTYNADTVYGGKVIEDQTHGYSLSVEEFIPGGKLSGVFEITFAQGIETEDGIRYMVTDMFTLAGGGSTMTIPTEIRIVDEIVIHEWDEGVVTVNPDCTQDGEMTFTCTACGETKTQPIPANGHEMSEWIITAPADCTQDGEKYRECVKCEYTETATIPAKGHIWDDGIPSPDGNQTTHTCPDCEETKTVVQGGNITVGNASAGAGKTVTVDILIDGNPGISNISLEVAYDRAALTLTGVTSGEIFESFTSDIDRIPVSLAASDEVQNRNGNGTFATLTFNISTNCTPGIYDIKVQNAEIYNIDGNQVIFDITSGTVEVEDVLYGDVTGDGTLNRQDLLRLAKYFAGWDVDIDGQASDVTGDGTVNRQDLLRLAKYFAGWNVILGK